MVPIEQKDGTEQDRGSKPGEITHSIPRRGIFITAYPEDRIREQVMRAGAIDFLSKPFDEPRLLECVKRALTRYRGHPNNT
jgi:FixJ family two-component response regulator